MIGGNDFVSAISSLWRAKGYVFAVVLTLGVSLGALVALFNLNYQLLAVPLPYPDEDRLFVAQGVAYKSGELDNTNVSPYPARVEAYKSDQDYFELKALVGFGVDNIRNLSGSPRVNTGYITPEYLEFLRASLSLGRIFKKDEGLDTNNPVAVISYKMWQEFFSADPEVLGKALRFGDTNFRIIGVTSEKFIEPELLSAGRVTQVWLPWDYNPMPSNARSAWGMIQSGQYVVGKLKSGVEPSKVEHELSAKLNGRFKEENSARPFFDDRTMGFKLLSFREAIIGDNVERVLLLFAGGLAWLWC